MIQPKLQPQSIQICLPCEPFHATESHVEGDSLHITFEPVEDECFCPHCGEKLTIHSHRTISLRALPIDRYTKVYWDSNCTVHRCKECDSYHTMRIPWQYKRSRVTVFLAKRICKILECQNETVKSVSEMLCLSWDRVRNVHKEFLKDMEDRLPQPDSPELLVVDEFSIERGQSYATLCINGKTKQVLYVEKGRDKKSFEPFFSKYDDSFYAGIGVAAMDQNAQYDTMIRKHMPHCTIVSDYFHMMKNYTDQVLSPVRLRAARDAKKQKDTDRYWRFKRAKRLQSVRLDDGKDDVDSCMAREELKALMLENEEMDKAVHMKEELLWMYDHCRTRESMEAKWDTWVSMAKESGIDELARYAENKDKYCRENILAHAEHPVSSGVIEGCMNKIKVLKRVAFGYRDMEYFFLRVIYIFLPYSIKQEIWNRIWDNYGCPDEVQNSASEPAVDKQKCG